MKPPLYVPPFIPEERAAPEAGFRARDTFTVRRGPILRASAQGQRPSQVAEAWQCGV
ncbi:MAG: hypothetical protein IT210_16435 [Armatimonadetes bacterium]|nr:hypothetical protein [Armatimonadota bacterium]